MCCQCVANLVEAHVEVLPGVVYARIILVQFLEIFSRLDVLNRLPIHFLGRILPLPPKKHQKKKT